MTLAEKISRIPEVQEQETERAYRVSRVALFTIALPEGLEWNNFLQSRFSKVLMIRKGGSGPSANKIMFAGGKLEKGEDWNQAAEREIFEETGLWPANLAYIGNRSYSFFHDRYEGFRDVQENLSLGEGPPFLPLSIHEEANIQDFASFDPDEFENVVKSGQTELIDSLRANQTDIDSSRLHIDEENIKATQRMMSSIHGALLDQDQRFKMMVLGKVSDFLGEDFDFEEILNEALGQVDSLGYVYEKVNSALQERYSSEAIQKIFDSALLAAFLEYQFEMLKDTGQNHLLFVKILESNGISLDRFFQMFETGIEFFKGSMVDPRDSTLGKVFDLFQYIYENQINIQQEDERESSRVSSKRSLHDNIGRFWMEKFGISFSVLMSAVDRFIDYLERAWRQRSDIDFPEFPQIHGDRDILAYVEEMRRENDYDMLRRLILSAFFADVQHNMPVQPPFVVQEVGRWLSDNFSEFDPDETDSVSGVFSGGIKDLYSALRKMLARGYAADQFCEKLGDHFRYMIVLDQDKFADPVECLGDLLEHIKKELSESLAGIEISNVRISGDYIQEWADFINRFSKDSSIPVRIQQIDAHIFNTSSNPRFRWLKGVVNVRYNDGNKESFEIQIFPDAESLQEKMGDDARYIIHRLLRAAKGRYPVLRLLFSDDQYFRLAQDSRVFEFDD